MHIEVYFRDQLLGRGVSAKDGEEVIWSGDIGQLKRLSAFYERQGFRGEKLLNHLLTRLRGNCWSRRVDGTETKSLAGRVDKKAGEQAPAPKVSQVPKQPQPSQAPKPSVKPGPQAPQQPQQAQQPQQPQQAPKVPPSRYGLQTPQASQTQQQPKQQKPQQPAAAQTTRATAPVATRAPEFDYNKDKAIFKFDPSYFSSPEEYARDIRDYYGKWAKYTGLSEAGINNFLNKIYHDALIDGHEYFQGSQEMSEFEPLVEMEEEGEGEGLEEEALGGLEIDHNAPVQDRIKSYEEHESTQRVLESIESAIVENGLDKEFEELQKDLVSPSLVDRIDYFLDSLFGGPGQPELDLRIENEEDRDNRLVKFLDKRNAIVHKVLGDYINANANWQPEIDKSLQGPRSKKAIKKAFDFVRQMITSDKSDEKVGFFRVPPEKQARSHYIAGEGVYLADNERNPEAAIHELGHYFEETVPGIREVTNEFLRHRLRGEKPVSMKKIFPKSGYRDGELGMKDEFDKVFKKNSAYYFGKRYDRGEGHLPMTEVYSMLSEAAYKDFYGMLQNDREMALLWLGLSKGTLRKPEQKPSRRRTR